MSPPAPAAGGGGVFASSFLHLLLSFLSLSLAILFVITLSSHPQTGVDAQMVSTFAGTGVRGFQDGPAATALFTDSVGVAVNTTNGNVYVGDFRNHRIRLIKDGVVSTVASINYPYHVALDTNTGNIYTAQYTNNAVALVTLAGAVSTISGAVSLPVGVTFNPKTGDVYVADFGNNRVQVVRPNGATSTLVSGWNEPYGVFFNPTNDKIYCVGNTQDLRVLALSGSFTILAGSGTAGFKDGVGTAAQFNRPYGVTVDPTTGNVYVGDTFNYRIRLVRPDGTVSTLAGSGTAGRVDGVGTAAQFGSPNQIAFDHINGKLYVADSSCIRLIGDLPSTVWKAVATSTPTHSSTVSSSHTGTASKTVSVSVTATPTASTSLTATPFLTSSTSLVATASDSISETTTATNSLSHPLSDSVPSTRTLTSSTSMVATVSERMASVSLSTAGSLSLPASDSVSTSLVLTPTTTPTFPMIDSHGASVSLTNPPSSSTSLDLTRTTAGGTRQPPTPNSTSANDTNGEVTLELSSSQEPPIVGVRTVTATKSHTSPVVVAPTTLVPPSSPSPTDPTAATTLPPPEAPTATPLPGGFVLKGTGLGTTFNKTKVEEDLRNLLNLTSTPDVVITVVDKDTVRMEFAGENHTELSGKLDEMDPTTVARDLGVDEFRAGAANVQIPADTNDDLLKWILIGVGSLLFLLLCFCCLLSAWRQKKSGKEAIVPFFPKFSKRFAPVNQLGREDMHEMRPTMDVPLLWNPGDQHPQQQQQRMTLAPSHQQPSAGVAPLPLLREAPATDRVVLAPLYDPFDDNPEDIL